MDDLSSMRNDQDMEWAIGINCWSLKLCGISSKDDKPNCIRAALSKILVPLYALFITIFAVIPQTFALFKVWGDLTLMVDNLVSYFPFVVTLCKIVTMWFKKEEIIKMVDFIRDDWSKLRSKEERDVMIKYAQLSRIITFGAFMVIVATVMVYHPPVIFGIVLRTLTNLTDIGERPFVLQSIYLIDVYKTPIYELTVISQFLSCSIAGFCYVTVAALFGMTVLHVCSQLENLQYRIEAMTSKTRDMKNYDAVDGKNFENSWSSNVREHQRLIRFVEMIEGTFSIMLMMIVPAFTLTFCIQGFQLISSVGDEVKRPVALVIFCIVFMSFIGFVMFVYSSVGQTLVIQSEAIQYAAYNCEWYNLRPEQAVLVIIIQIRAQRPLQITAGKFVPINLTTFATLLKTTAGYISCLLAVHE